MPPLIECLRIPDIKDEIPTPEAAAAYSHLREISSLIPEVDTDLKILLLLGRDIPEVHHVVDKKIGEGRQPFAQKLSLGPVLIGKTFLERNINPLL